MSGSGPRGLIHQALLYASTEQFLASAVPFISDRLAHGAAVIAYADPAVYCAEHGSTLDERPAEGVEHLPVQGDLAALRAFAALHAARLGAPSARLDGLILAVNEVATNALRHGAARPTSGSGPPIGG